MDHFTGNSFASDLEIDVDITDVIVPDEPPFNIALDPARSYLEIVLNGVWSAKTYDAYADAYKCAVKSMASRGGLKYILVDALNYGVLTPELAERAPLLVASTNPRPDRRSAVVIRSVINRAQSREGCAQIGSRTFRTVAQARDWLFSNEA